MSTPQTREPETLVSAFGRYLEGVFAEYVTLTECKRLVNQVSALQRDQGFKILAITSLLKGEGKSFTALSLAYGYVALCSKRVLVVDASVQTVNRALSLEHVIKNSRHDSGAKSLGTLDILSTRSLEKGSKPESSDFEIVPYVRNGAQEYDLVLVDTCSLRGAQKENLDPVIVAGQSDAVIMVTSSRSGSSEVLSHLESDLKNWRFKVIGSVFNRGVLA